MTPFLKTARLLLYAPCHRKPDVDAHVAWLNDKSIVKYSEQRHRKHTVASQWDYIKSFDQVRNHFWEISNNDGSYDMPIGSITANIDTHNSVADVGILIGDKAQWGRGLGTESWQKVCDWLLDHNVRKIEAGTMASNKGMLKIFFNTHMQVEGIRYRHFLLNGKPEDKIMVGRFK